MPILPTVNTADNTADDELDPEIRRFRQLLAAGYAAHPDLATVTKAEARRIAEAVRAPLAAGGPVMAHTQDAVVPGAVPVRVRIHRPGTDAALPALVYLHGGGWTLFSIDTHDRLMREYAHRAGVAVVGVDYALAPEAPYPVALRQVAAVVGWLRGGQAPGIDGMRLALGGDSAGGNLALAAAMHLRDRAPAHLRALVLNYGAYSRSTESASHRRYSGPEYLLNSAEMLGFWRDYLGDSGVHDDDPLAQPLLAPIDRLRLLPPVWLAVAQCDVLHDDSIAMAERLRAAGVSTSCVVYPGTTHGFVEAASLAAVSRRALDETAAWLRQHLAG